MQRLVSQITSAITRAAKVGPQMSHSAIAHATLAIRSLVAPANKKSSQVSRLVALKWKFYQRRSRRSLSLLSPPPPQPPSSPSPSPRSRRRTAANGTLRANAKQRARKKKGAIKRPSAAMISAADDRKAASFSPLAATAAAPAACVCVRPVNSMPPPPSPLSPLAMAVGRRLALKCFSLTQIFSANKAFCSFTRM